MVTRCTVAPVDLDAVLERLPLGVEPGKRGKQRRVDVEDAVGKRVDERRPEQAHEPGQADQIDATLAQLARRARDRIRRATAKSR